MGREDVGAEGREAGSEEAHRRRGDEKLVRNTEDSVPEASNRVLMPRAWPASSGGA